MQKFCRRDTGLLFLHSPGPLHKMMREQTRRIPGLGLAEKTRWAINDKTKFKELIDYVRDLVGRLYKILPVTDQERNYLAINDIKILSDDVDRLRIFEEASLDAYPAWSGAASVMLEARSTQLGRGTIVSQWMDKVEDESDSGTIWFTWDYSFYYVFTSTCPAPAFGSSCDEERLEIQYRGPSHPFKDDANKPSDKVDYKVIVDDRIPVSCCPDTKRLDRLRSLVQTVYEYDDGSVLMPGHGPGLLKMWIAPTSNSGSTSSRLNSTVTRPLSQSDNKWMSSSKDPFTWLPRMPMDSQIFKYTKTYGSIEFESEYLGTFTTPKPRIPTTLPGKRKRSISNCSEAQPGRSDWMMRDPEERLDGHGEAAESRSMSNASNSNADEAERRAGEISEGYKLGDV
ncbi:hypothetical protein B0H63DRAFT_505984 [Podospora didyma]|uniref:Prion-inhibition and propagation HeLo domain-containing protein n=1 Tax=Podospora didyma TaxID=330526 RepID=A0AAE0U8C7_9PEZI|nr:hypothetical protein B0H63DRAFT_505984 [Podospora didyma]